MLTILGGWSLAHIVRRSWIADHLRYRIWKNHVRLRKDKKISLPKIDVYINGKCNLTCEHCVAFSPFRDVKFSKEDVIKMIELWSERIAPEVVNILGGEPLLHDDYREIVKSARARWPDARILLYSNGLLLHRVDDEFLVWMKNNAVEFSISRHINTNRYLKSLDKAIDRFKSVGVSYEIIESHKSWVACHTFDADGVPIPCKSDPRSAWNHCLSKYCTSIFGRHLFRCSPLMNGWLALQENKLPSEWNEILNHKPASIEDTSEEILKYLHDGVMKDCSICPDSFVSVEARQMSPERLKHLRSLIHERNAITCLSIPGSDKKAG
jgi:organic radical activating enzyme